MFVKHFFNFFLFRLLDYLSLPCIVIISCLREVVKRFFQLFLLGRVPEGLLPLPLDTIIIPHPLTEYNWQNAQISGLIFVRSAEHFLLDKLLGLWYNGNSGRVVCARPAILTHSGVFCQVVKLHKK